MTPRLQYAILVVAIVLIMGWLIAGCATTAPVAPTVVSSAPALPPVRVPVLVPCLTRDQIPRPPATWMNPARSGGQNEIAAALDLKEADEYMVRSQTLLWGCVKSFEEEKPK